jgi:outer membrane protein TolC
MLEKGLWTLSFRQGGLLCLVLLSGLCLSGISGCSTQDYKREADEEVYRIIDQKWQAQFGPKVNYRISDVTPSPDDIFIPLMVPPEGYMSLARAVALATAHNREYQTAKENLYLTTLALTLERDSFRPKWFGLFNVGLARGDENLEGDEGSVSFGADYGFEQLLADGTTISANIALDWARFLMGDPRTTLGSVLTGTITRPLMRGSGRRIAQENLTQAERDALYQIRTFNRFRKTFVVSVITSYYRVLQLLDVVKNEQNNYEILNIAQQRVAMLADAGRLPRFETDQAEQDKLRAWDRLVRARQEYKQALDEFKLLLALPTDAEVQLDPNELAMLTAEGITEPDYSVSEAVETALVQRLDLSNSRDAIWDAERKVLVAADGLGTGLNLIASASVGSTPDTGLARMRFHDGYYSLGLELDLPLERTAERNAYREAQIILMQSERAYEEMSDQVKLQVRQAYRQLQEAATRHQIQLQSVKLAEARVESTSLLLQAGRATTRDLLDSQDDLLRAQNELTSALVDHAVAKLNFFRDVGVLQVRSDGLWEL